MQQYWISQYLNSKVGKYHWRHYLFCGKVPSNHIDLEQLDFKISEYLKFGIFPGILSDLLFAAILQWSMVDLCTWPLFNFLTLKDNLGNWRGHIIFFYCFVYFLLLSETTEQFESKLVWNVTWLVLYNVKKNMFLCSLKILDGNHHRT